MNRLPSHSRSAIWSAGNALDVRAEELVLPVAGELLVRIRAAGICGSDLHRFRGPSLRPQAEGIGPGHELAGEVVSLGPGVVGPAVGSRVAVFAGRVCTTCKFCVDGRSQLCRRIRLAGQNFPGGIAEHFIAQEGMVFPVPDGLDWPVAALAEPFSVAVHGLDRARMEAGRRVLVIGAGTIGLATALAALDLHAERVGVVARHGHQAELARALGAHDVFDASALDVQEVARANWDLVVESVGGAQQTLQQAIRLATPGGTVLLLGVHQALQTIDAARVFRFELTVVGSFGCDYAGQTPDFMRSLALIERHRHLVQRFITHTFRLDEVDQAFDVAFRKQGGAIKVTVLP